MRAALLFMVAIGFGIMQSNAQVLVSPGIKIEGNVSNLYKSVFTSKMKLGATVGGFAKIEFGKHFALQPELLFHLKNSTQKDKYGLLGFYVAATFDYQYVGAEIPLYAVGQGSLGNGQIYLGIGPYVGFGFSAKYKFNLSAGVFNKNEPIDQNNGQIHEDDIPIVDDYELNLYEKFNDGAVMQRWDVGFGVMLGYEFNFGMQINAGYKMGLSNLATKNQIDRVVKNQAINFGLAYKF